MTIPHPSTSIGTTPLEQPCEIGMRRRQLTIGLPRCEDPAERRFPLTPEGAAQLSERGFRILMQKGAADSIHYADEKYLAAGVLPWICTESFTLTDSIPEGVHASMM